MIAIKDVQPDPGSLWIYVTLHGKMDFAGVMKGMDFEMDHTCGTHLFTYIIKMELS